MAKIKIGASLYGFTNEQRDLGWTTEDCLKEIREIGFEGFECVAAQTFENYPWPTDEQIYELRDLAEKYELVISSYSSQADRGKRTDIQDLSEDDLFAYALNDIKYAHMVGAKAQRQQCQITPQVMRRLAPWAEAYDVKVGIEMHTPMVPCEAACEAFNKVFEEVDSPYIGWNPDFGMFDTAAPQLASQQKLGKGMTRGRFPSRANIPAPACDFYEENYDLLSQDEMMHALKENFGLTERQLADVGVLYRGMDVAGDARNTAWEDFEHITVPHSVHFHGKFNRIGDDGDDLTIHTSRILEIIGRSDYDGFISIEYEGHGKYPDPAAPILREHLAFYRKVLKM